MSNNSQDEPDEYEIIFDGTNSNSASNTKIEVSDAEPETDIDANSDSLRPSEYIDAEVDESDSFMQDHQSDAEDADIEEGIFAPVRKKKGVGKKTASLMWAVSLLAFVGVGAFVYVTHPDILSKVTNNLGGGEDVTLPNGAATADVTPTTSDTNTAEAVTQLDPTLHAPDNTEAIKPDVIAQDGSSDLSANPSETMTATAVPADTTAVTSVPPVETPPVAAVAPTTDLLTPEEKPVAVPAEATPATPTTATTVATPTVEAVPAAPDATSLASTIAPTSPAPHPDTSAAVNASVPKAVVQKPASVESPTPSDVITPTIDKEEDTEEALTTQPVQANPSTVAAPTVSAPATTAKDTNSAVAKTDVTIAPKDKGPVIVASKEEKKVLDDANLDKYFDSPNGKMLKDIPAPSMDPSKGSHESIIVVNKKAKKTNTDNSHSTAPISIETTSLNTQLVSANRAVKLGRYDAAKEMYDDLYKLNPRDVQILSGRAILLQKMGFNDQAISAYEELLDLYPDNTDAIVNLSGLIRKQYPAVALGKLLDLHMSHPNNVAVTAQLGVAYADAGNYADALRYLGDAAAMDPKNAQHFYNMAVISEKAKKPEQAVTYYEKALEVDAIYGEGHKAISKEKIYDRLAQIRGN